MIVSSSLIFLCLTSATNLKDTELALTDLTSLKSTINTAIVKFEKTPRKRWSYQVSRYENEEGDISSRIEQYKPTTSDIWHLKELNGQKPTAKQAKQYLEKKLKSQNANPSEQNFQIKLRELINQESLQVKSENNTHVLMTFNVHLKKLGEDAVGKLKGELAFHKKDAFIERVTIWNKAEFSPMFSAKITDLSITFNFLQINNSVLPESNEMEMKGNFAYFSEINETSIDSFSNYQFVGQLTK